jgi:hypothetical protein
MRAFSTLVLLAAVVAASACKSSSPKVQPTGSGGESSTGQGGSGGESGAGQGGSGGSSSGGQGGGEGGSVPFTGIGAPCAGGCATGYCGSLLYCTKGCATDADCAPSAGSSPNRCLATSYDMEKQCFAGCASDADCASSAGASLTCRSVGTGGKVCTFAEDKGSTPLCQGNAWHDGPGCTSGGDCHCGETCFDFQDGSGFNCGYSCTSDEACTTLTGGLWIHCWMGDGVGSCGP